MQRAIFDHDAETLLAPVRAVLDRALRNLPPVRVRVALGDCAGFYAVDVSYGEEPSLITLDRALASEPTHHRLEREQPLPGLDRWRRAAASVLEGAALVELARRADLPVGTDWRWLGAAIYAADLVAPELSIAPPELALALETGDLGQHPRAGVAAMLAWKASGVDPIQQARYLIEGGVVSATEWLDLGSWLFDPNGPGSMLAVPVGRPKPIDVPGELPPWSWKPVAVDAHPRGGRILIEGEGKVRSSWAVANQPHRTTGAALSQGCKLVPHSGGPTGNWAVASAEAFGQVIGARGIEFRFRASGMLELVLADAFVGPMAALAMAEEMGTSGICAGRWSVSGPRRLQLEGLETASLTLHGRNREFMMPASGFGLGEWLAALDEAPWAWKEAPGDRLVLRGTMRGGPIEVRLKRA